MERARRAGKRPGRRPAAGLPVGQPCEVCGIPDAEHPRCYDCGIAIGPGHIFDEAHKIDGVTLCAGCAGMRRRRGRAPDPIGPGRKGASDEGKER